MEGVKGTHTSSLLTAEDSASEEDNISDTENNTSNINLQDSQSQFATSGFLTSTQYPDEQESQVINSLNGSPTQGQMEADDSNTLNLSSYNNTAAAPPSVPDRSIIPLLPVNSNVADAARVLATSYTQLLPDNRNALPTGVLSHSPSLSPAHRTSPLAHVNRRLPTNMEHLSLPLRQSQQIQLPSQPQSNDSNDKEATFKHRVLRFLCQNLEKTAQLEAKMDMLIAKSNNNLSQSVMENDQSTLVDMSELPLKTRDDLVAYKKLSETNADQYFKLVRMVKQIGGETLADADKPQKHKLQGMKVTEAIFRIRHAKEFAQVTDNALMKETRNAVKHAAETVRNKTGIVPQEPGSDSNDDLGFHIQEEYDVQRLCRIELRNNVDTEETEGLEEVVEFFIKEEATFIEK
ncbi:hypothetical protein OUZ56_009778 [Daphnia magna]|uniref:Uncharacterized protein n=2 Tax=Daphnia magna TaxID=35525 RepID=A0ABR0AGY4_9CRUS|nr:hypothetical protein OUZ56_009778 [Daphnia magna]